MASAFLVLIYNLRQIQLSLILEGRTLHHDMEIWIPRELTICYERNKDFIFKAYVRKKKKHLP